MPPEKRRKEQEMADSNDAERLTIGKVLYTQDEIRERAKELGAEITRDYEGKQLVVLGMLKGAVPWMAELIKYIDLDIRIDFIAASSYGSSTISSGVVKIKKDVDMDLYKKDVLIVEDIVDTGNTLAFMKKYLEERGPSSVKICSMLDKPSRRTEHGAKVDYKGFTVEDMFIIGYGLDYDEKFRNLPYISYLESDDVDKL